MDYDVYHMKGFDHSHAEQIILMLLYFVFSTQVFSDQGMASAIEMVDNQCIGDPLLRSTESNFLEVINWVFGVWRNLNNCFLKLGFPLLAEGPCAYFECPMNPYKPHQTYR